MSETSPDTDYADDDTNKQLTLNEAYHLTKKKIVDELRKRACEVSEDIKRDILCQQLIDLVLAEIVKSDSQNSPGVDELEVKEIGSGSSEGRFVVYSDESSNKSSMADSSKLQFHLKADDWDAFVERLELYFSVKKIEEDTMQLQHC